MLPLQGVLILIAIGAVKFIQAVGVLREVGGDPVHDNADTGLMEPVHQVHEIVGRAVAGGDGEIACHLIAPGAVEGIFHQRHELHVGVAHLRQIRHQLVRQRPVGVGGAVLIELPGARVHLVDVHRRGIDVPGVELFQVFVVVPLVARHVEEFGGVGRTGLRMEGVGIRLHAAHAVRPGDGVFIGVILFHAGKGKLPDAVRDLLHGGGLFIPAVELPCHAHGFGSRRPDTEHGAVLRGVCTEVFIGAGVAPLFEKIDRQLAGIIAFFMHNVTSFYYFIKSQSYFQVCF